MFKAIFPQYHHDLKDWGVRKLSEIPLPEKAECQCLGAHMYTVYTLHVNTDEYNTIS